MIYAVAASTYCYPDSSVLRNKMNIRDGNLLKQVEADISAARQTELLSAPVPGRLTPTHLCHIHRALLGDIYSFAGHYRREDIAKGNTRFLSSTAIKPKLTTLLAALRREVYLTGTARSVFISRSAHYMAELNYIHPFREGNGRAIREFMRLLFLRNGYSVFWDAVDPEELLHAMINSVYDTAALTEALDRCLVNIEK